MPPGPNSNAVAIVTIQDQDLVSPGLTNLVQRLQATVVCPSPNAVQYSGYQLVTATTFVAITPGLANIPFVYVRNASPSGNNTLVLQYLFSGGPAALANLAPGGIFLFANNVPGGPSSPFTSIQQVSVAVFFQAPVIMEYLFAY